MKFYKYSASSFSFPVCFKTCRLAVKALLGNFLSAILSLLFAVVGMVLGAIAGCIEGQESGVGILRGAAVGAIFGVLTSFQIFDSFRRIWHTDRKRIQCLLYLIDVMGTILRGRLIRELVGTVMTNIARCQVGDREPISEMVSNFYKTGGCKGSSSAVVKKIPTMELTTKNHADPWGEIIFCSVCLQNCQVGDKVCKLPCCRHMFHECCIDQWLVVRGSCPLCRSHL